MVATTLSDTGALLLGLAAALSALSSVITALRTTHHVKRVKQTVEEVKATVEDVKAEVETTNGTTIGALAELAEGRRITADVASQDRTASQRSLAEHAEAEDAKRDEGGSQ